MHLMQTETRAERKVVWNYAAQLSKVDIRIESGKE